MQEKILFIGIAGPSASGKSLLANTIVNELGSGQAAIIAEDSYYKDRVDITYEERCKINYDHPDAFDRELLFEHLNLLRQGKNVSVPVYDFKQYIRKKETQRVGGHRIIVLEGILLFTDPKLRNLFDICIFMDTALDICLLRRIQRDAIERKRTIQSVIQQYEMTVRPMYLQFIEPSKRYADIIIPHGGANRIAIDMIKAKLRETLSLIEA